MKVIFKNTSLEFNTYMFESKDMEINFSKSKFIGMVVNFRKGYTYKIVKKTATDEVMNFYSDVNEEHLLFSFNSNETEKTFIPGSDMPIIFAHVYTDTSNVLFTITGHSFLEIKENLVQSLEDIQTSTTPKDMVTSISLEENTYYKLVAEGDMTLTLLDSNSKVIISNMENGISHFYFGKAVTLSKATCFNTCNSLKIYKITSANV